MQFISDFDLAHVLALFYKRKKELIAFIILCCLTTTVITFLLPKQYLASAVGFPSNPVLADRSFIFNENIQSLYASYGSNGELDRLTSTAQLDTVYRFVIKKFALQKQYKIKDSGELGIRKTIKEFKKNYNIENTELGEIKIHTWDHSPVQSAAMANAIIDFIAEISTSQNNTFNRNALRLLQEENMKDKNWFISLSDSLRMKKYANPAEEELAELRKKNLVVNLAKQEKLIFEYTIAAQENLPSILIQEYAKPQVKANRPNKTRIVIMAFILSLLFSILLVFALEFKNLSNT